MKITLSERIELAHDVSSLRPFLNHPPKDLITPEINLGKIYYLTYPSKHFGKDTNILIVVRDNYDLLYIDLNGDYDLTNDGNPRVFKHSENKFNYRLYSEFDSLCFMEAVLIRKPENRSMFDDNGNIYDVIAKRYREYSKYFTGEKGTFYFLSGAFLSHGSLLINDVEYQFGLMDGDWNHLFNDVEGEGIFGGDILLIDLNGDGKLSFNFKGETFKLNDIFHIDGTNYEVSTVDKYGRYLEIKETEKQPTNLYLHLKNKRRNKKGEEYILSENLWDEEYLTILSKSIQLNQYKGQYILLNFWGEWCTACINEIPELEYVHNEYGEKIKMISFIKTRNLEKAKEIITTYNMGWPQIVMDEKHNDNFRIHRWPTNIFIKPDGSAKIIRGSLNRLFFLNLIPEIQKSGN